MKYKNTLKNGVYIQGSGGSRFIKSGEVFSETNPVDVKGVNRVHPPREKKAKDLPPPKTRTSKKPKEL